MEARVVLLKQKLESWKRTLERLRDQRNILAAVTRFFAVHQATFVETLAETFHLLSLSSDSSFLRTFTLSVQFAGYSVALPVQGSAAPGDVLVTRASTEDVLANEEVAISFIENIQASLVDAEASLGDLLVFINATAPPPAVGATPPATTPPAPPLGNEEPSFPKPEDSETSSLIRQREPEDNLKDNPTVEEVGQNKKTKTSSNQADLAARLAHWEMAKKRSEAVGGKPSYTYECLFRTFFCLSHTFFISLTRNTCIAI